MTSANSWGGTGCRLSFVRSSSCASWPARVKLPSGGPSTSEWAPSTRPELARLRDWTAHCLTDCPKDIITWTEQGDLCATFYQNEYNSRWAAPDFGGGQVQPKVVRDYAGDFTSAHPLLNAARGVTTVRKTISRAIHASTSVGLVRTIKYLPLNLGDYKFVLDDLCQNLLLRTVHKDRRISFRHI